MKDDFFKNYGLLNEKEIDRLFNKEEILKLYEDLLYRINKKHDKQIKNKPINCPNCGAPITDYMCEYCGTVF